MPLVIYKSLFERGGDRVAAGLIAAADPTLTQGRDATVAAFESAGATVEAWKSGETLDLRNDLAAIDEGSTAIAEQCDKAQPDVEHKALIQPVRA
jgi:hypothetical protein